MTKLKDEGMMKFLKITCLLSSMFFFSSNAFAGEAGVSVSGPDILTNGACYSATGGQAPYLWKTSEGSISSSGCVSDVSGRCGSATITASDDCRITGSKEVILHGGVGAISISGPDAPSNGSCYVANNAVGAVQWGISKGSINSNGCVSNISGQCGAATVTATDSCGETAVKDVRMPSGFWLRIYNSGPLCATCGTYFACPDISEISGAIWTRKSYGCTENHPSCLIGCETGILCGYNAPLYDNRICTLRMIRIYEWRCP